MSKPKPNASALIDAYFEKLDPQAEKALTVLRAKARDAHPALQEDFKWSAPCGWYKGLLFSYMAFKEHLAVWFHDGILMSDPDGVFYEDADDEKLMRSIRFRREQPLGGDVFMRYLNEAIALRDAGNKPEPPKKKPLVIPNELKQAFKSANCWDAFAAMSLSHQREYVQHYTEAKRESTRQRRLEKVIQMISAGKGLNDKYKK